MIRFHHAVPPAAVGIASVAAPRSFTVLNRNFVDLSCVIDD